MVWRENGTPVVCPYCGVVLDESQNMTTEGAPKAGDVFLCSECVAVGIHASPTMVRKLTDEERDQLLADPVILNLRMELIIAKGFPTT